MNPFPIIDINDYELSGGGAFAESYIRKDNPEILLKVYPHQYELLVLDEFDRASKAYQIGVPCPEPGDLVQTADGRVGIQFKRIIGKISYARATANHPERVEEYAAGFAGMCKQLHAIKPLSGLFPKTKDQYSTLINENGHLSVQEKDALVRFIQDLPDGNTAVHGDLHFGNAIFTEQGNRYFIDLGEFTTGTPLFDLGIVMRQTYMINDQNVHELYHMEKATATAFWNCFVAHYFGPDVPMKEVVELLEPYHYLRGLTVEFVMGRYYQDHRPFIQKIMERQ